MKAKRIKWLDFGKGFAIIFVILAHWLSYFLNKSDGYLYYFIVMMSYVSYTFVMPLFFAISGYLYRKIESFHDYILLIYKKGVSLLIPYMLFSIPYFPHGIVHHQINSIFDVFLGFKFGNGFYLWFLLALFCIFVLVGLMDILNINLYIQLFIFILLTILQPDFWLLTNNTKTFSMFSSIVSYAIIFYLGIILRKLFNKNNIKHIRILQSHKVLFISVILWLVILFIQSRFTSPIYQTDFLTLTDTFTKISIIIISFLIFKQLNHNVLFNYIDYYGRYTLVIYLVHMIILTILEHMSHLMIFKSVLPISLILGIIITGLFSIYCCYLSKRFKFVNFIFYPRKYINKFISRTKFGKWLMM